MLQQFFKKAKIKSDPSNYRPISLTSTICKIVESIIIENCKQQFGFIKGRSTALQLLCIMDEWKAELDSGAHVDVIYTDFAKAFDTVL